MKTKFKTAFQEIVIRHEGGYVDDPDDAGGETYMGISRKYHPGWLGWGIIGSYKHTSEFPDELYTIPMLQAYVERFYKEHYWDTWRGDEINKELAVEMFDVAVNMGVMRAVMFCQKALNFMNLGTNLWPDLVVDGHMGPKTITAIRRAHLTNRIREVVKIINILQGMHYLNYMKRSPIQEKYARGWLKRVSIHKD